MAGRFDGRRIELEVAHRFASQFVRLPDGLHWNLLALFAETLEGLRRAAEAAPLDGIGIDSWGVDYALLDRGGRVLGDPVPLPRPRAPRAWSIARTPAFPARRCTR